MSTLILNKSRDELAKLFKGTGAEIGVERGLYSEIISKECSRLYCIDAYQSYPEYHDHERQSKLDRFFEEAVNRLGTNCEVIRAFSMDAVKDFEDESLDFVYIDANHDYKHVTEDITEWSNKVKKGGIIAGHDYVVKPERELYDVVKAVDDYCKANGIQKLTVYMDDNVPSWMFTK